MAYDRRSFGGGAVATTITGAINASVTSIPIAASTGWPSGSAGDFFVVIDRGTASEEKVRIDTRSGLTLTVVASTGRGSDGTTGVSHASGATIEVCGTATDLDEANAHLADTALDHHTQYLTTGRHDLEARHTFGAAYGTPAAAADIAIAAATGTGDNPAREDHVHKIGTGAINSAAMFAANVIDGAALGDDCIDSSNLANSCVVTAALDLNAVQEDRIADSAVATAKIADAAVTPAKIAATAWSSYTPTNTDITLGNGTLVAKYLQIGKTVYVRYQLTWGSTTLCSAGPNYPRFGLPTTSINSTIQTGPALLINTGTREYIAIAKVPAGAAYATLFHHVTTGTGNIDSTVPFTWTAGDIMQFSITYETA